jgi:general secretion pathway protein G
MNKSRQIGFTLIELIIVMVLIGVLAVIMIATLNPKSLTDKGTDAQRKKDLGRIRVAFEEYFNDKGCFPTQAMLDGLTCNNSGFKPWIGSWPCDPDGSKYYAITDGTSCPRSYKLLANLRNRSDKDIPTNWYAPGSVQKYGDGTLTNSMVNYGVSSQNTSWSTETVPAHCYTSFAGCYIAPEPGRCNALPPGIDNANAYLDPDCSPECVVSCCNSGQICVSP